MPARPTAAPRLLLWLGLALPLQLFGSSSSIMATKKTTTTDVLFRTIEEWHSRDESEAAAAAATAWSAAAVLDAGTGRTSLRWLTGSVQPQFVTAVTADPARAAGLREEFSLMGGLGGSGSGAGSGDGGGDAGPEESRRGGEVLVGSWVPNGDLPPPPLADDAMYDVVLADYLLGAVDVFTPYFQPSLFPSLVQRLRRGAGARMYVVGLQPLPDKSDVDPRDEGAQLLSELVRTRDACITLAGHRPHREYPVAWVRSQLESAGLEVAGSRSYPNIYRAGRCGRLHAP
jgi:hypothetical protein